MGSRATADRLDDAAGDRLGDHRRRHPRHEHPLGDVSAGAVECFQSHAGERGQQHREVKRLLVLGSVERLVQDAVGLDLADVRAGDPVDPPLGEQRGVEDARWRDVAGALEVHAAHPEVPELVLVGDPDDLCLVAHAAFAQLELEVDDVLERRSLARARAVADSDQECSPLPAAHPLDLLVEPRGGLRGMAGQADREAVARIGSQSGGLVEPQRRTGRVDQEVVADLGRASVGELGGHVRGGVRVVALGVDLAGASLHELDPRPLPSHRCPASDAQTQRRYGPRSRRQVRRPGSQRTPA